MFLFLREEEERITKLRNKGNKVSGCGKRVRDLDVYGFMFE